MPIVDTATKHRLLLQWLILIAVMAFVLFVVWHQGLIALLLAQKKGSDHHKHLNYIEATHEKAVFHGLDGGFLGRYRVFKGSPTTYSCRIGSETGLLSDKIGAKPRELFDSSNS